MLETDRKIWDAVSLFHSRLGAKVEPDQKPLANYVPPKLKQEVEEFVREYGPVIRVEERRDETRRRIEREEERLEETYLLATEVSLAIQLATVRHPELREQLKPRIGGTPEEHAANLSDMRQRLTDAAPALKKESVKVLLEERHGPSQVSSQLETHAQAEGAIRALRAQQPAEQQKLDQLRKRGGKLQTSINRFLSSFFEDDRASQVAFGLTERSRERGAKAETDRAAPVAPVAAGGSSSPGTQPVSPLIVPTPVAPAEAPAA